MKTRSFEIIILLFSLSMLLTVYNGVVFHSLWTWFLVPLGVINVTYWQAFGVSLFATWLKVYFVDNGSIYLAEQPEVEGKAKRGETALLACAIGMAWLHGMAFLIHYFIL